MSEWKESGIIRRDFRASKDGPEVMPHRAKSKKSVKKNRARWCRGKTGVEHQVVLVKWYMLAKCQVCGMNEYKLSLEALAQVYPRAKAYLEYSKLCKEYGHQYEEVEQRWFGGARTIKMLCAICSYSPQIYVCMPVDNSSRLW